MSDAQEARVTTLADALGCMTEQELILLAQITPTTAESWRKRGAGPGYVIFGNRVLYPRESVREFLASQLRDRPQLRATSRAQRSQRGAVVGL